MKRGDVFRLTQEKKESPIGARDNDPSQAMKLTKTLTEALGGSAVAKLAAEMRGPRFEMTDTMRAFADTITGLAGKSPILDASRGPQEAWAKMNPLNEIAEQARAAEQRSRQELFERLASSPPLTALGQPGPGPEPTDELSVPPEDARGFPILAAMKEFATPEWEAYLVSRRDRWARLHAAWKAVEKQLAAGDLLASGFSRDVRPQQIPSQAWEVLQPRTWVHVRDSIVTGTGLQFEQLRVRVRPGRAGARLEARCREWFRQQVAGPPRSRKEMLRRARQQLDSRLTNAAFDRVWEEIAPKSWKKPGRKPSN